MTDLNYYLGEHSIDSFYKALEDGAFLKAEEISREEAEEMHHECTKILGGVTHGQEILYDDDVYYLLEQAYLSNHPVSDNYTALCVKKGEAGIYRAMWEIQDWKAFREGDEDCCNWDKPCCIEKA